MIVTGDDGREAVRVDMLAMPLETTGLTAPQLFAAAASLVEQGLRRLDVTETKCAHCDARRFHNYDDMKVAERLNRVPVQLRESAARLENVTRPTSRPGDNDHDDDR